MATIFGKPPDVQDKRRFQKLLDQHGREWGATIELKTGDPTGLIDPRFKAPLYPPPRFLKVDSRKEYGRVEIDYDGWIGMLRRAWEHYNTELLQAARAMYGDAAAQKVEERPLPPALLAHVGPAPEFVEPVLAAKAGDPWILGLSNVRPKWADRFMPVKAKRSQASDELAFMRAEAPQEVPETAGGRVASTASAEGYPVMYAPGRWRLSDGSTVQGKKADAVKAQDALSEPAVPVGTIHSSWSGAA